MRWRIEGEPQQLEPNLWVFRIATRGRSKNVQVRTDPAEAETRGSTQESLATGLVKRHLDDRVPPDTISLAPGWDFERQQRVFAEMGFTNVKGLRMRWVTLAHRLNLPHWLQPRP